MTFARPANALALAFCLGLAACSSPPAPPLRYHPLRLDPPAGQSAAVVPGPAADQGVWQLMLPIKMPEYLDRDALWAAVGSNGLQPLDGHRWAEPLRSAVPRTLANDLGAWHGAGLVWSGTPPAGVVVARQWRVELLEFAPSSDRKGVHLRARWLVNDPRDTAPAQAGEADIEAPMAGPQPDQLVDAYRLALWRLAERMAASVNSGP